MFLKILEFDLCLCEKLPTLLNSFCHFPHVISFKMSVFGVWQLGLAFANNLKEVNESDL